MFVYCIALQVISLLGHILIKVLSKIKIFM